MNVFAGQDGDADIEDRLGDTGVDERELTHALRLRHE